MSKIPADLLYTEEHEYVKSTADADVVQVGITDYAQDQLGDVVYVELPKVGAVLEEGKSFGTVESVKTLSDLFAPLSGKVVEVNEALTNSPELVNEGAYDKGWMIAIESTDPKGYDALLDAAAYRKHLEESAH